MTEKEMYGTIYVLSTEPGVPPRAVLGVTENPEPHAPEVGEVIAGTLAIFSGDMGAWTVNGLPVPSEIGEAITEHARNLGVAGF